MKILRAAAWAAVLLFAVVVAIAQQPATTTAGAGQATVVQTPTAQATVGQTTAAQQRPDGQIEADVVKALDSAQALKNEPLNAATTGGEVTIFGTVSSDSARQLAVMLVSKVSGVVKVTDHLKVSSVRDGQQTVPASTAAGANASTRNGQPDAAPVPAYGAPQPQEQSQAGRPVYQQGQSQPNAVVPPQDGQQPSPAGNYDATPITIPAGTLVQLRTVEALDSKHAQNGMIFELTVIRDVRIGGKVAIPRGATAHGVVVESKQAGQLGGAPVLALELQGLDLGGQSYTLASDAFKVRGPNKAGYSASNILGGAGLGTLIGAMVGRGPGAAIGAVVGAGAGTAVSAATPGARAWIPSEALVAFHLEQPVTVTPVSPQEAQQLGQGLFQGGPNLNRRGAGFYAGAPYPAQPGYPYPNVEPMPFYHPYFMMGGFYYWR